MEVKVDQKIILGNKLCLLYRIPGQTMANLIVKVIRLNVTTSFEKLNVSAQISITSNNCVTYYFWTLLIVDVYIDMLLLVANTLLPN